MGANSKIQWTDHTFNPFIGCTKVSPGCEHCYAEAWAKRYGRAEWGPRAERVRTGASTWRQPLRWNAEAERTGKRPRVFCASLADVFDNRAPDEWRVDLWRLIASTPALDWLLLTKRVVNVGAMVPPAWLDAWPAHVWLGITVTDQAEADRDIPLLLEMPAPVRFLSCEPLLGQINLLGHMLGFAVRNPALCACGHGHGFTRCPNTGGVSKRCHVKDCACSGFLRASKDGLHWVIAGGESGPNARPIHPDWVRGLRDQCAAAGVPFLFKQWGEWSPQGGINAAGESSCFVSMDGTISVTRTEGAWMFRRGKRAAGRELDGRTWDQIPASPAGQERAA
jgi:protein gp37